MLESVAGFHIEPTNICTLKCPRCSRTKFIEKFPSKWKNQELNLDHLKNFIDIPIHNKLFRLCGDYGDPIYYSKLFDLVEWIKNNNARISLHTNGSYRTIDWWQKLSSLIDENDSVVFAIDGVPDNFTNYRINADWQSIRIGIETVSKKAHTVWQFIPFKYNIDSIEEAKNLSHQLGVKEFLILNSSRWESENDPYRPNTNLNDREIKFQENIRAQNIDPRCKQTNYDHFISANGFYAPCCHVPNHNFYYKSIFYKDQANYDISKTTITQVLERTNNFYNNLETNKPIYCIYNCPKYE
jgi:MoaA/NifB/PqqE/SkfB family radical SAM enzyme